MPYPSVKVMLVVSCWIQWSQMNPVKRAASDLAVDFGRVTGKNGTIETRETLDESASPLVVAGTIGQSTLVDELVAGGA
ncbi:hypothetical protein V2G26_014986 [Clonostachys chloroleuca]